MQLIYLARYEQTARALVAATAPAHEERAPIDPRKDPRVILFDEENLYIENGVREFERLVWAIRQRVAMSDGSIPLNQVAVIVDRVAPAELLAARESGSWDHLLALLILSFPEVKWHFAIRDTCTDEDMEKEAARVFDEHSLTAFHTKARRDPILDPTGLREWVKQRTWGVLKKQGGAFPPPERRGLAAAMDDEKGYAYFHGYVAWRFGYRSDVFTSYALLKERFGPEAETPHSYKVLLEDMHLRYPDQPKDVHLSWLGTKASLDGVITGNGRGHYLPALRLDEAGEPSEDRVLITAGIVADVRSRDYISHNQRLLCRKSSPGRGGIAFKPLAGIYGVWKNTGMWKRLESSRQPRLAWLTARLYQQPYRQLPVEFWHKIGLYWPYFDDNLRWATILGAADGFHWPPENETPPDREADSSESPGVGHSAPGKLLLVAECLVKRAELFEPQARTVKDCVKGAVLATEAMELLQGLTPGLSLQALSLKHEFEAMAEVSFMGVGAHLHVTERAEEVRSLCGALCRHFRHSGSKGDSSVFHAALDAEMLIMNRLARIYRNAGQMDEEGECMARMRWANRQLSLTGQGGRPRGSFVWFGSLALAYAEWLMARLRNLAIGFVGCLLLATLFWCLLDYSFNPKANLLHDFGGGFQAFLSGDFLDAEEMQRMSVAGKRVLFTYSAAVASIGVFHIGVFLSYLFSLAQRK
jgi:hypothetical protein